MVGTSGQNIKGPGARAGGDFVWSPAALKFALRRKQGLISLVFHGRVTVLPPRSPWDHGRDGPGVYPIVISGCYCNLLYRFPRSCPRLGRGPSRSVL